MKPGIYKAEWGPGLQPVGGGLLVFMHNIIAGADIFGCVFDGQYAFDSQGSVDVRWLKLQVPAGVQLAQGIPAQSMPYILDIPPFKFNIDDAAPTHFVVPTTPNPLNVRLTRIRRLDPDL